MTVSAVRKHVRTAVGDARADPGRFAPSRVAEVGRQRLLRVVLGVVAQGPVQRPQILQTWRAEHGLDGDRAGTLGGSVVHDRHRRGHRPHLLREHVVARAVVRDLEDIDLAEQVHRTRQLVLEVPGQIAEVDELEFAGTKQIAEALAVFAGVFRLRLERVAERIPGAIGERLRNELAVGRNDDQFGAAEVQALARLDGAAAVAGDGDVPDPRPPVLRPSPRSRRGR